MFRLFGNRQATASPVSAAERLVLRPLRQRGGLPVAGCLAVHRGSQERGTPRSLDGGGKLAIAGRGVILCGEGRDRRNVSFLDQTVPEGQHFFCFRTIESLNPGITLGFKELSAAGPSQPERPRRTGSVEVRDFHFAVAGLREFLRLLSVLVPSGGNSAPIPIKDLFVINQGHS